MCKSSHCVVSHHEHRLARLAKVSQYLSRVGVETLKGSDKAKTHTILAAENGVWNIVMTAIDKSDNESNPYGNKCNRYFNPDEIISGEAILDSSDCFR